MAEFLQSPLSSIENLSVSSPPSPELLLPPILFIAIARFSCASLLIEPKDIAPVLKRLTISVHGSTSSIGIGSSSVNSNIPRIVISCFDWSFTKREYSSYVLKFLFFVACCNFEIVLGFII